MTSSPSRKMQFINRKLLKLASCPGEPNRIHQSDGIALPLLCPRRFLRPMIGGCCSYCHVHGLQPLCDVTDQIFFGKPKEIRKRQMKISQLLYRLKRESVPLKWEPSMGKGGSAGGMYACWNLGICSKQGLADFLRTCL